MTELELPKDKTDPFEESIFPVWVFDIDNARVLWANQSANELWEADSITELTQRDMGSGMSNSVRARLLQYQKEFENGVYFDESWTLYPKDKAKTVLCRFRGCRLASGRMAMLCEAQLTQEKSSAILHGSQALLYTGAMVTIYNTDGDCIYANPAALHAFTAQGTNLSDRIMSVSVLRSLESGLMAGKEGHYVCPVKTQEGARIHEIEARKSFDSVSGMQTLLLTELDIDEKEQAKRRIEHLANHDFLTGLRNRQYLTSRADDFILTAAKGNENVFLLLIDLDRFKYVNDTFGHVVGDKLLKKISSKLKLFFPKNTIISRFGGDEFCILMRSNRALTDITRECRELIATLKSPIKIGRNYFAIDASVGLAYILSQLEYLSFHDLLVKADLALYSAKENDGDRVQIFREKLYLKKLRFLEVEDELASALQSADGRLTLSFQPIVCLETKKITGLEALARLRSRSGANIPPTEFIPIAESTGMISELGGWVLKNAVEGYLSLPKALRHCRLSVNVSPMQFQGLALLVQLRLLSKMPGFDPSVMEIELTETALQIGESHFSKMLQEIVSMGYTLAIDDFGSAYSNIARLNGYPVQTIKIDRSLMANAGEKLMAGAIEIVRALNLSVVVEGIETKEQSDWLISKGCTKHQGFYYARALSKAELCLIHDCNISSLKKFKNRVLNQQLAVQN